VGTREKLAVQHEGTLSRTRNNTSELFVEVFRFFVPPGDVLL